MQTQALSRLDWCQQWTTYHKLPTTIVTSLTLNTSFSSPGWLKCVQHTHSYSMLTRTACSLVQHAHSRKVMYMVRGLFSSSIYTLNMRNSLLSSNQRAFSQAGPCPLGANHFPLSRSFCSRRTYLLRTLMKLNISQCMYVSFIGKVRVCFLPYSRGT